MKKQMKIIIYELFGGGGSGTVVTILFDLYSGGGGSSTVANIFFLFFFVSLWYNDKINVNIFVLLWFILKCSTQHKITIHQTTQPKIY